MAWAILVQTFFEVGSHDKGARLTKLGFCAVVLIAVLALAATGLFDAASAALPVTLSPTSLSFGSQLINTTSMSRSLTLTNSQTVALNISRITTTNDVALSNKVSVWTYLYNNSRTGANMNETILTPAAVNVNQFGKLFSAS
jgi:hypothetical protein